MRLAFTASRDAGTVLVWAATTAIREPLEEVERRYIERVMQAVSWSKTEATRVLGIDRSTLYRKLDRYAITPPGPAKPEE